MSTTTNKPSHSGEAPLEQPNAGPAADRNTSSKETGVEKAKTAKKARPKAPTQRTTAAKQKAKAGS